MMLGILTLGDLCSFGRQIWDKCIQFQDAYGEISRFPQVLGEADNTFTFVYVRCNIYMRP